MVVDYFEGKLEEIIRNAVKQGVEFDGLKTTMFLRYFISQDMADKIDANCCLKQEDFDRNEVLNNIVEVFFGYYFINETKGQLDAEKYFNNPNEAYEKSFVVNYERFVNYLMSRGFDVDIPNFDVALEESLNGVEPTIIADLTKETKKTR